LAGGARLSPAMFNSKIRLKSLAPMWLISGVLVIIWFILKLAFHKGGYIHMLLVAAFSMAVVQIIADRKTRYHKASSDR
jgi:Family of unknown function (DUF5670)